MLKNEIPKITMKTDIILAGVGGQGILSIATIIGNAALKEDLYLKQAEVHGMSQRGGDVQSNLRISDRPIASDIIAQGAADIIISLEPMEALRYTPYLAKNGWIVTNTVPFNNITDYPEMTDINEELMKYSNVVAFDMDALAKEVATLRSSNMVLLGAAAPYLKMDISKLEEGIRNVFASKGDKIIESNLAAFRAGLQKSLELSEGK